MKPGLAPAAISYAVESRVIWIGDEYVKGYYAEDLRACGLLEAGLAGTIVRHYKSAANAGARSGAVGEQGKNTLGVRWE